MLKKQKNIFMITFLLVLIFKIISCQGMIENPDEKNSETSKGFLKVGVVNLNNIPTQSFSPMNISKSSGDYNDVSKAVITIKNPSGNFIFNAKVYTLYNFSGVYISEEIDLPLGDYVLTRFFIADSDNNVLFATPYQGSELEDEVDNALPISFTISENSETTIIPQVISLGDYTSEDFGFDDIIELPQDNSLVYPEITIIKKYLANGTPLGWESTKYLSYYRNGNSKVYGAGPDKLIQTADDIIYGWFYDRFLFGGSWCNDVGPDGLWFTEDDTVAQWECWENPAEYPIYRNPGADAQWFTEDDVILACLVDELDADGNIIRRTYYDDAGVDNEWFTDDDVMGTEWFGAYYINTYEGENNRWWSWTKQIRYNVDNSIKSIHIHTFDDGTKFYTREDVYSPGSNGLDDNGTGDDVLIEYHIVTNTY